MKEAMLTVGVIFTIIAVLFAFIAVRAVIVDKDLNSIQRKSQIIISVLFPILGPFVVLYFISQHHTKEELKSIVPWPFSIVIIDKQRKSDKSGGPGGSCGSGHCGGD